MLALSVTSPYPRPMRALVDLALFGRLLPARQGGQYPAGRRPLAPGEVPADAPPRTAATVLPVLPCRADAPAPSPSRERVLFPHDLSTLTEAGALRLEGKQRVYRMRLDSPAERVGDCDVYECASDDDTTRTLWLPAGVEADDGMS